MIKIVLTGPESTGKTTLARALGKSLSGALVVPEFARLYLEARGSSYTYSDFSHMASGQQAYEQWYAHQKTDFLICDTDHVVFSIWSQEKFGFEAPMLTAWRASAPRAHLYLLCSTDLNWTEDPLREHPHDRERLFTLYRKHLEKHTLPYQVISGSGQARVNLALDVIKAISPL